MAFSPDLDRACALYMAHAPQLFALCYLHGGGPQAAGSLQHTLLCDLTTSPRRWQLASSGDVGLFRCAHSLCMDQAYRRPKRKKKKSGQEGARPRSALPFTMSDALRALLALPPRYKTPLYLRLALGWSAQDTAAVTGGPAAWVDKLVKSGLKRAKLTEERARTALLSIAPPADGPQDLWDGFLVDRSEKTFPGMQRLRRFKRGMDHAIPYIALGVVVLCVLAYQGVERGWFSGQAYVPDYALGISSLPDEASFPLGEFTVFVPDPDSPEGLVKYLVADAPQSSQELVRQMVALGGAPEGTALRESIWSDLECGTSGFAIEPAAKGLTLELSAEAGEWFASAAPREQERMLLAMTKTFCASYPRLERLVLLAGDEELTTAGGNTAQAYLGTAPQINREANAPYRP